MNFNGQKKEDESLLWCVRDDTLKKIQEKIKGGKIIPGKFMKIQI